MAVCSGGGDTPQYGTPAIVDETLEQFDVDEIKAGRRGRHRYTYSQRSARVGRGRDRARARGLGGVRRHSRHALPGGSARARRGACRGEGRRQSLWGRGPRRLRRGHRSSGCRRRPDRGGSFSSARWDLLPTDRYMWASVQTVRGCPKHCSFCSVWRTDGQKPRQRESPGHSTRS